MHQVNPEFGIGLALPDLLPGFSKFYNTKIASNKFSSTNFQVNSIASGVVAHYDDDKLFHGLHDFNAFCHELVNSFLKNGLNRSELRLSLIAHLLIEILFDRWLCEQNENLPHHFYEKLEQLNTQSIHLFFDELEISELGALVLEKRSWFLEHRFLHELQNTEQMTMGVGRIYERLTSRSITKNEQFRIIDSVNNFYNIPRLWQTLMIR